MILILGSGKFKPSERAPRVFCPYDSIEDELNLVEGLIFPTSNDDLPSDLDSSWQGVAIGKLGTFPHNSGDLLAAKKEDTSVKDKVIYIKSLFVLF